MGLLGVSPWGSPLILDLVEGEDFEKSKAGPVELTRFEGDIDFIRRFLLSLQLLGTPIGGWNYFKTIFRSILFLFDF